MHSLSEQLVTPTFFLLDLGNEEPLFDSYFFNGYSKILFESY